MIPLRVIDEALKPKLSAEGTDHYDLEFDRIPAINSAQNVVMTTVTSMLHKAKEIGESLRDLNFTAVFQTNEYGQIAIDQLLQGVVLQVPAWQGTSAQKLWTVLAVYPEFQSAVPATITTDTVPSRSSLRQDVRMIKPLRSAKYWTEEMLANVSRDPFAPGNNLFTGGLKEYGYSFGSKPVVTGSGTGLTWLPISVSPFEIGVRQLVAVNYLKVPVMVPSMVDENDPLYNQVAIEWPESMTELIVEVALRNLTFKQGDGTTLNSLSTQEMSMLLNSIT